MSDETDLSKLRERVADAVKLQQLREKVNDPAILLRLISNIPNIDLLLTLLNKTDTSSKLLQLTTDANRFPSPQEIDIALLLINEGRTVQIIEETQERSPDFIVDSIPTELKTIAQLSSPDLSGALTRRILEGAGQGSHVIADVRLQAGLTPELAERAVRRTYGADTSKRIQQIRIIGRDFDITRRREDT